jgi:hypothetical protein
LANGGVLLVAVAVGAAVTCGPGGLEVKSFQHRVKALFRDALFFLLLDIQFTLSQLPLQSVSEGFHFGFRPSKFIKKFLIHVAPIKILLKPLYGQRRGAGCIVSLWIVSRSGDGLICLLSNRAIVSIRHATVSLSRSPSSSAAEVFEFVRGMSFKPFLLPDFA